MFVFVNIFSLFYVFDSILLEYTMRFNHNKIISSLSLSGESYHIQALNLEYSYEDIG